MLSNKNNIKLFWTTILLLVFICYIYYYKYCNKEGFTIFRTGLITPTEKKNERIFL